MSLDFSSGKGLTVCEIEPCVGLCWQRGACLGFSPSLCSSPTCTHSGSFFLSLKNKQTLKKKKALNIAIANNKQGHVYLSKIQKVLTFYLFWCAQKVFETSWAPSIYSSIWRFVSILWWQLLPVSIIIIRLYMYKPDSSSDT